MIDEGINCTSVLSTKEKNSRFFISPISIGRDSNLLFSMDNHCIFFFFFFFLFLRKKIL